MSDGAARVLEALREAGGRPCSGGALAERLGVTRAQVWKHVEPLRRRGYEIEGTPGGGYALGAVPDRLYPEEIQAGLATRWLAREIEWLEVTDSTNRVAGELARAGRAPRHGVIAEGQTAGRGRLGRCVLLAAPPEPLHLDRAAPRARPRRGADLDPRRGRRRWRRRWPTASATRRRVELKWPNDVLARRAQDLGHPDGARRRGDAASATSCSGSA